MTRGCPRPGSMEVSRKYREVEDGRCLGLPLPLPCGEVEIRQWGYPHHQTVGLPPPSDRGVTPTIRQWGYPHHQTEGLPPPSDSGVTPTIRQWGYPHHRTSAGSQPCPPPPFSPSTPSSPTPFPPTPSSPSPPHHGLAQVGHIVHLLGAPDEELLDLVTGRACGRMTEGWGS